MAVQKECSDETQVCEFRQLQFCRTELHVAVEEQGHGEKSACTLRQNELNLRQFERRPSVERQSLPELLANQQISSNYWTWLAGEHQKLRPPHELRLYLTNP